MIDFWKSVIEHILSWPVAAFFLLGFLFREPLTALIERINNIKGPGFELAAPPASAQIEAKTLATPDALKGEIGTTTSEAAVVPTTAPSGVDAVLEEKRQAVRKFGEGIALAEEGAELIKKELVALEIPLGSEDTAEILVRHLAVTQLMVRCERTHRLIFGSQLVALHLMNNVGPQPESALTPIFENARAQEPQFYGSYTFENWIGFLINAVTVTKSDHDVYAITVYGRTYLEYIGVFAPGSRPH